MEWIALAIQLGPFIFKLIEAAESFFSGPKQGAVKKAAVKGAVSAFVDGMIVASTGGQKDTWARIEKPVDGLIDNACKILFPSKDDPEAAAFFQ